MKNLLVSMIVACVSSTALAESYLCITEAAGGVYWRNGKWGGTDFGAEDTKYLLKGDAWYEFGESYPSLRGCETVTNKYLGSFTECKDLLNTVRINKKTLRFSRFHTVGFIDGQNNNDNNPFISVGTCSRLD